MERIDPKSLAIEEAKLLRTFKSDCRFPWSIRGRFFSNQGRCGLL